MKPTVYIETTIISYLTARPSRDLIRYSHQLITRDWWESQRQYFDLRTSPLTVNEAALGDQNASKQRLEALRDITLLDVTPDVFNLANDLAGALNFPARAAADAVHVAAAAISATEYLLTWNCKHLANVQLWDKICQTCEAHGLTPPRIATPEQLMESP